MKLRILPLVLLLFLASSHAYTQSMEDFLGGWYGYITQEGGLLGDRYAFELELERGDFGEFPIIGTAHIAFEDKPDVFGVMEIEGVVEQGLLRVTELSVIEQRMYSYAYWCIKTYDLEIGWVNDSPVLSGNWASDDCGETYGQIHLERRLS